VNFNKVNQENINKVIQPLKGKITMFDITKQNYQNFISKMEKSDFKNSSTRYLSEISLLEQMKKHAQKDGFLDEISSIDEKIVAVRKILKENFGISFK